MKKRDLLKAIGFSEEYISKLDDYSTKTFKISSTSIENETYSKETQDNTSLEIHESTNNSVTELQFRAD